MRDASSGCRGNQAIARITYSTENEEEAVRRWRFFPMLYGVYIYIPVYGCRPGPLHAAHMEASPEGRHGCRRFEQDMQQCRGAPGVPVHEVCVWVGGCVYGLCVWLCVLVYACMCVRGRGDTSLNKTCSSVVEYPVNMYMGREGGKGSTRACMLECGEAVDGGEGGLHFSTEHAGCS